MAKFSNVVKNDVVKKTDYNTLKRKLHAIDISGFVTRTNDKIDKVDKVEKKIPDISGLATKSSVTRLITEQEDYTDKVKKKIPDISGLASKTELTAVENKILDATNFVKKSDYATEITSIKNDYVTNASLDSKINDLKAQHIATEVKTIDDKTKKNASDILGFENRLKQKEDIVDENQRELSFNRGFFYYLQQNYLVYECKIDSFNAKGSEISTWKSTGISNHPDNSSMNVVVNSKGNRPVLIMSGLMRVHLYDNYFTQNKALKRNSSALNIYIAYELNPISSTRNTDYTIQNALFGAMKITKNTDSSKNNCTGYGLCFDEGGEFSHTVRQGNFDRTTSAKNVIIFGVDMSSSIHATNRANNIYVMGKDFIQGINGTTIYAKLD